MKKRFPSLFIACAAIALLCGAAAFAKEAVRTAYVAGAFYASKGSLIEYQIDNFLTKVRPSKKARPAPRLMIVPHAGYVYSGQTAAHAYAHLEGQSFDTVVMIGPYHKASFPGASVWTGGDWQTPIGSVPVDEEIAGEIYSADKAFQHDASVHRTEHSLEVQVPFLQRVLKNFKIVPVAVNDISVENTQKLAAAVAKAIEGKKAIVLISTDMSHYYPDGDARRMDGLALRLIEKNDILSLRVALASKKSEFCGAAALLTGLELLNLWKSAPPELLDYSNSGDSSGDKNRVVGYASLAVYSAAAPKTDTLKKEAGAAPKKEEPAKKNEELKKEDPAKKKDESKSEEPKKQEIVPKKEEVKPAPPSQDPSSSSLPEEAAYLTKVQEAYLLHIARRTLETYLVDRSLPEFKALDNFLSENAAVFVTLKNGGRLRGCIGSMAAEEPLYLAVQRKALQAATEDPRFSPVTASELRDIRIEISVLSFPKKVQNPDQIVMGRHGVIAKQGRRMGVFLPQVASETGWSREQFLNELCSQKAGLSADAWKDPRTELYVFTANSFSEAE